MTVMTADCQILAEGSVALGNVLITINADGTVTFAKNAMPSEWASGGASLGETGFCP